MTTSGEPAWQQLYSGSRSDLTPGDRFYHGTRADLEVGDLIEPGRTANFGESERRSNYVYFSATRGSLGSRARARRGTRQNLRRRADRSVHG